MSEVREERFGVDAAVTVDARLPSGELVVTAGEAGEVRVRIDGPDTDRFVLRQDAGTVWVRPGEERRSRWRRHRVTVHVPSGARLVAATASADVSASCALDDVEVESASGDVRLGRVERDCRITSASGELRLGRVGGDLSARSASGEVSVEEVGGAARVKTASGEVRLGRVGGELSARSASGDVAVEAFAGPDADVRTTSGDVRLGLPPGRSLDLDVGTMSGKMRSDFSVDAGDEVPGPGSGPGGALDGRVRVRAVSGDVHLRRASA